MPETIKVMRATAASANLTIDWHPLSIGKKAFDKLGNTMPPGALDKLTWLGARYCGQGYCQSVCNDHVGADVAGVAFA